jgi:hypothetical protein
MLSHDFDYEFEGPSVVRVRWWPREWDCDSAGPVPEAVIELEHPRPYEPDDHQTDGPDVPDDIRGWVVDALVEHHNAYEH